MGGFAWVTLATNDSYSLGALVLANSLKQVGTKEQLAVLVTPGVTSSMKEKLSQVFNVVYEVNILDSKDAANLRLLQRPELGITFTKLHCWRLVQFDKCVFLDADTLVLQNCDELFEREELSAAPDVGWPDCFNSGVFVFRPSNETYEKLIQFALDKGSFDGGDQGLLNLYFSDWATKDISKHLPFIYNLCSTACYSYLPAFKQFGGNAKIMHFIGASKPWLQYFDTESRKVQPSNDLRHLEGILQHWWNIFCQLIHPNLSTDMGGLAGAFAQLTLGAPRTSEQLALDDHLRRQGWEVGNIDYMGRDSFDNIWSKICQTIGTSVSSKEATPPPPPPPVEEPSPVPASEAAVPSAPEATSEPIASLPEISPSCNIQTISIEIAPITTIEPIPLPQTSIEPEKPTELIEQSPTLPPSQETSVAAQKTEKSIPATTDAPQQTTEPPKTTEAIPELSQPVVCPCKPPPPPFPEVQPTPETVPSVPKLTASPPKILSTELLIEPISPTPDVVPITEPKTDTKASETIESVKSEPELEKTISQPIQQTLQSATPISESTNIPAESKQIAPEPAKPASEPTKPATEPAKPVSEPTKPATEPAKPALEPVKPASEPVKPVSEPVKPASEPAKPTSEPVAESTKPASKLTESVKPGPEPTKPVSEPDKVVPEVQKSSSEITKPLSETIKPASKSSKPLSEPTKQISKSTKAAPEAPKPQTDAPKSTKPAAESGKTTKESPACAKPVEPLQASAASTKNVPVPESSKPEDTAAETSKTKAGDASQTSPTPPPRKTGGVKKTKAKK